MPIIFPFMARDQRCQTAKRRCSLKFSPFAHKVVNSEMHMHAIHTHTHTAASITVRGCVSVWAHEYKSDIVIIVWASCFIITHYCNCATRNQGDAECHLLIKYITRTLICVHVCGCIMTEEIAVRQLCTLLTEDTALLMHKNAIQWRDIEFSYFKVSD